MSDNLPSPSASRLAIVLSHPVQYYSPWFQWLAASTTLTFRVFYLWDFGVALTRDRKFQREIKWDLDLLSGYDSEFVPNAAADPGTHHFRGLHNPGLTSRLAAWRPDAVLLFGYNWRAHLTALAWAGRKKIPVILRGDSHLLGRSAPGLPRYLVLRTLFSRFAAFLPVGAANREYYRTFGVPVEKLFFAPHAVDAQRFSHPPAEVVREAGRLRAELGLQDRRVVLFAGKFTPAKQPLELLRAFQSVAQPSDALVFVGDGELRPALEAEIARHPNVQVHLLPFANQTEMPVRYRMADLFALPSRGTHETWGLAVNEAMHCGLPCLVSDRVGCQRDLVEPGVTGWVFRADDAGDLATTLRGALAVSAETLQSLGAAARQRVSTYSFARAGAGLLQALHAIESRR